MGPPLHDGRILDKGRLSRRPPGLILEPGPPGIGRSAGNTGRTERRRSQSPCFSNELETVGEPIRFLWRPPPWALVQCPLCGKDIAVLESGICDQCASERKAFLEAPEVVDVTRCAHCGRLQRSGGWVIAGAAPDELARAGLLDAIDLDPVVTDPTVDIELRWEDERNAVAHVMARGSFRGHPVEREKEARVRLKTSVCVECSRQYGGYFEAILQIRASDPHVLKGEGDRVLQRLEKEVASYRGEQRTGAYVSKSERVRGGFDLYMGSLEVARLVAHDLADRFGADYAESGKLVGRRDGRDLYRFTLLVRLPAFLPGDFILLDERAYKVLRHEKKRLTLWDLERREKVQREAKRAQSLKVIGRAEDEREAVVVSARGRHLQVLDPATYKTVDLSVDGEYAGRTTVHVFRHEDTLYVLPEKVGG